MKVVIDFETASRCDLKKAGAAAYAQHPTTEVLCLVWKHEGRDEWGIWCPLLDEYSDLTALRRLAEDLTVIFVSHASFEQYIWHYIMERDAGMPPLPPERWEDTQATAAWRNLPLKLEMIQRVLGASVQKDMEGSRLTISLSKPHRKTGMLDRSEATIRRVIDYCKTDVAAEEQVLYRLGPLSPAERKVWVLDQEINQRGVRLDMEFVAAAQQVIDRASVPLLAEFRDLTGGVNPGQRDKVIEWCAGQGVELENLQKGYLTELLGTEEEDDGYESLADDTGETSGGGGPPVLPVLPATVRRVLEIRQMLGSASIKKLAAMRACVGDDGRARGLLQYHAAGTGRWGGRLLQPQNFPRGTVKADPEAVVSAILTGDPAEVERAFGHPAIECVASSLRHALVAEPGKTFLVGDFAGIEARIVLALAGQHDKTELMAAGYNAYFDFAETMFHKPPGTWNVTDPVALKQIKIEFADEYIKGKGGVLGCGFQCGPVNFNAKFLGGKDFATAVQTVETYRNDWAPRVPELWQAMKDATFQCVAYGRTVEAYGCVFSRQGEWMAIDLPSGWQRLWYYAPAMRDRGDEYGLSPSYMSQKNGRWQTVYLYGGIVTENDVQALARGLLVSAMGRLTQAGMPIVLTVHDEVICEVDEAGADLKRFERLMAEPTRWSDDMRVPVAVEVWAGGRYRK